MRFKTDENLPEELAGALRDAGWDALSVGEQRLSGRDDAHIAAVCTGEDRILVTLDVGFGNIKSYPPHLYPGIIVLRLRRQDKPAVLAVARRLIEGLAPTFCSKRAVDRRRREDSHPNIGVVRLRRVFPAPPTRWANTPSPTE
jgi:predicted nuclease of predicted toxin-antitoxin system